MPVSGIKEAAADTAHAAALDQKGEALWGVAVVP